MIIGYSDILEIENTLYNCSGEYGVTIAILEEDVSNVSDKSPHIIILTELIDNPGPSVTNSIQCLLYNMCDIFPNVNKDNATFVEHYEKHNSYDLVNFNDDLEFTGWEPLSSFSGMGIEEVLEVFGAIELENE